MKHIETIQNPCLKQSLMHGGCGANKENNAVLAGNEGKLNRSFGK